MVEPSAHMLHIYNELLLQAFATSLPKQNT